MTRPLWRATLVLVLVCVCLAPAFADEAATDGGLLAYVPELNGGTSFRLDPDVSLKLEKFPESHRLLDQYLSKNSWGNTLLWTGGGVELGGLALYVLAIKTPGLQQNNDPWLLSSFGVIGVGLVLIGVATYLLPSSYDDLLASIQAYNTQIVLGSGTK